MPLATRSLTGIFSPRRYPICQKQKAAAPSNARLTPARSSGPSSAPIWTGGSWPNASMSGRISEPINEPRTKKGSATSILPDPPPKLNNTPEPHPLASCMPMPKAKAPTNSETEIGASEPDAFRPHRSAGMTIRAHSAASRKCAAKAMVFPATMKCRQPDAKPY